MSNWISVDDRLPKCSMKPDSFGVEVLVYPPTSCGDRTAFYGVRVSKKPCFYRYGAPIAPHPNYWMPLPEPPQATQP
jgi:hypothetical protein